MGASFDPKRVAEIRLPGDRSPHLLVRGNMPLVNGYFAYEDIEDALDLTLADDRFISVSLIDNTGERSSWSMEIDAFGVQGKDYPSVNWPPYLRQPNWDPSQLLGTDTLSYGGRFYRGRANMIWWPFEGMSEQDEAHPEVFLHSPGWNFSGLVDHITGMYRDGKAPVSAIYVHCMLGADRTGALHAGLLINAGQDVDEAIQIVSNATAAGAPSMDYQRLIRAYAKSKSGV